MFHFSEEEARKKGRLLLLTKRTENILTLPVILSEFLDFFFSFALKIWNNFKLHFFLLKEKILFYFIFESEVFPSPYLSAAVFSVLCEISVKGLFLVSFFSRVLGPAGLTEQGWGRGEDPVLALA